MGRYTNGELKVIYLFINNLVLSELSKETIDYEKVGMLNRLADMVFEYITREEEE